MKKYMLLAILCTCICAYGNSAPSHDANPPRKSSKTSKLWKSKKVKVYGYDRARTVKKVKYLKGYDYYRYANRKSYLKMMGKAINGDRYFRY